MKTVDRDTAGERLRAIVASILELRPDEVGIDDHFYDDLQSGSLEKVEIAVRIEREFGVGIAADEAARVQRLSDALALLRDKGAIS
ncbi:acyl carrier protein [Jidongwangia harbinensis]|uniref:acyl carrier protein n=1 Tax=Jidongwangia harbinensis TaxID=2878561 RepID=UPI001CD926BC|nr:phosphopantetheine-binding protein [Jidongwangia harbinensis]MCA2218254.1 phosphopantetheine-binding protein [Jidongwangia harbinensis]